MNCFRLSRQPPYYMGDKNELYSRNPKTVTYVTDSVLFMAPKICNSASGIQKLSISIFFQKKYKEMETKLAMSVMQNLLPACWFFIMNICGTGIKTFLYFIIHMLYNRCIFFFFYIFSSLKSRC